jgi:hypothetical protein
MTSTTPDDRLDLSAMPVPGGFFLLRDVRPTPFAATPQPGEHRHVFSYRDSEPGIQQAAVELVRRAQKKIFLASFRIGDMALLNALFEAVERLRGGVYVITAWNERSLSRGLSALEEDAGADVAAQRHRFEEMTKRGIFVRGYDNCHAKFLVVDDEAALVSSANLETSALIDRPARKVTGESGNPDEGRRRGPAAGAVLRPDVARRLPLGGAAGRGLRPGQEASDEVTMPLRPTARWPGRRDLDPRR